MKKMTAVVALMAVFTLAICFNVIGAISEELKKNLLIGNPDIGSMVFALFLTAMVRRLLDYTAYRHLAQIQALAVQQLN